MAALSCIWSTGKIPDADLEIPHSLSLLRASNGHAHAAQSSVGLTDGRHVSPSAC